MTDETLITLGQTNLGSGIWTVYCKRKDWIPDLYFVAVPVKLWHEMCAANTLQEQKEQPPDIAKQIEPIAKEERNKKLRSTAGLFVTGFVQVYFVSANTYFLSRGMYLGVFIAAFMISLIWSFNVKKIAFGFTADRIAYAFGATSGSLFGLWSSSFLASILGEI